MSVAIGIDLGTTNTAVAAVVDGVAVTLEDEEKRRLLPSVVSFHPSGTVLTGEAARERRLMDPANTIFSVKPLLGRPWDSPEVQAAIPRFPFQLAQGSKNSTMVVARGTGYALPEISAFVLRRAKAIAEAALGEQVDRAVITVPANFNDLQRASTKIAGKLAGLEVMRILNEPTAAALAYGQAIPRAEKIGVYDLGGGTFDVTLLDLTGNVFEVLATAGDTALGGDDIDRAIANRLALDVLERLNVDPRANPALLARLTFIAEELKKELSTARTATREVTDVGHGHGGRSLSTTVTMTREELEAIAEPLIARTIEVARQSITSVGLTPREFDRVILVGGSTRMPLVARMVEQIFGQPPHLKVNPDEVVALGAAIQAHALNRSKGAHKRRAEPAAEPSGPQAPAPPSAPRPAEAAKPPPLPGRPPPLPPRPPPAAKPPPPAPAELPTPAVPFGPELLTLNKAPAVISFGTEPPPPPPAAAPALPLPDLAAPPPARTERSSGHELGLALPSGPPAAPSSPDLSGLNLQQDDFFNQLDLPGPAAEPSADMFAQGSAIATSAQAPLLIDVTPLSLGVETVGGYTDVLIPANSPVPCEKTRIFRTASDNQISVSIRVAQGESPRFAENTRLGDLELSGLRSAVRGEARVSVTFELDADGILNVRARDPDTGRETVATMRLLGTATVDEIGAMAARQAGIEVV
jgi:molecular chaperone DnaK